MLQVEWFDSRLLCSPPQIVNEEAWAFGRNWLGRGREQWLWKWSSCRFLVWPVIHLHLHLIQFLNKLRRHFKAWLKNRRACLSITVFMVCSSFEHFNNKQSESLATRALKVCWFIANFHNLFNQFDSYCCHKTAFYLYTPNLTRHHTADFYNHHLIHMEIMKTHTLLLLLSLATVNVHLTSAGIGFRQSVAAAGRLICNGAPSVGTWVEGLKLLCFHKNPNNISDRLNCICRKIKLYDEGLSLLNSP